jgi:uncharacterized phiE125 gp8 family phage protein
MQITVTTAPETEPISLAEVKYHLRLATTAAEAAAYTTEDDLLDRLIATSRIQTEQEIGRRLITQTWEYYLDKWPDGDIVIPYPPLQEAAITYKLEDDDDYDNTFSDFDTDTASEPGRLILQPDESWPTGTLYTDRPIKITYIAGYGDDAADVPEPIKQAILLKISDLYENRGEIVMGVSVGKIQGAIDSLLRNYTIHTEFEY